MGQISVLIWGAVGDGMEDIPIFGFLFLQIVLLA